MIAAWLLAASFCLPQTPAANPLPGGIHLLREADARIEKYRKADATIVVVDRYGEPVTNAQVRVEQTRHAFLFGCAALSLLNHADKAKEEAYQKQFGALFNFATILTYWHDTDPEPGRQSLDKVTAQARRLQEMGIRVKGHPLILAGAIPRWAPSDPDAVRDLNQKRIHDLTARFKGKIDVWDVVGDVTTAEGAQNGLGAWARKAGQARFTADALTWAREGNPNGLLMYNDYKLDADYLNLIPAVLKSGAPLDALGLEAHMVGSEWPLQQVWDTAETFRKMGKPLHFSEITVLSDTQKADHRNAWPSTPEGELRQAEYVEQLYTVLFSHPAVEAIAWWNFVDGDWDRIPGGLLRADLTPKPAYERLRRLIGEKWRTTETLTTDAEGKASFSGFAGVYRITVQTARGAYTSNKDLVRGRPNTFRIRLQ